MITRNSLLSHCCSVSPLVSTSLNEFQSFMRNFWKTLGAMRNSIQGHEILTRCYNSLSLFGHECATICLHICEINVSVLLLYGEYVWGYVWEVQQSFTAKSLESLIGDSRHPADLLIGTNGLSSGVYPPHHTWRMRLQIRQATLTQLPSLCHVFIETESDICFMVTSERGCAVLNRCVYVPLCDFFSAWIPILPLYPCRDIASIPRCSFPFLDNTDGDCMFSSLLCVSVLSVCICSQLLPAELTQHLVASGEHLFDYYFFILIVLVQTAVSLCSLINDCCENKNLKENHRIWSNCSVLM